MPLSLHSQAIMLNQDVRIIKLWINLELKLYTYSLLVRYMSFWGCNASIDSIE